jgi:hypothetical protein
VRWGREHGTDIEAVRGSERLLIEAKGEVASNQQQHNYFLGALGELVQHMDDPYARHGLALPGNRQYRRLVQRRPRPVWDRLDLVVFFVSRHGDELMVEEAWPWDGAI